MDEQYVAEIKKVAIEASERGGGVVKKYFEMVGLEREVKEDKSFVTEADKETERVIVETVKKTFPTHGFLGEEGGSENHEAEYVWVIDPIDGTGNFVNGIPIFAISIALLKDTEPLLGVIYNPITDSRYVCVKGEGVTYNEKQVQVSKQQAKDGAITFGYGRSGKETAFRFINHARDHFSTVRLLGSSVLDLAYIARGGTEAMVGVNLNVWDYAAGALMVQEAGGTITKHDGSPWIYGDGSFAASNGTAHTELLALLKKV